MKLVTTDPREALAGIEDGATVLIGGFGTAGQPVELIDALLETGATDLTVVNNNAGNGDIGLAALLKAGRVGKIVCSFSRQADSHNWSTGVPGPIPAAGARWTWPSAPSRSS